MTGQQLMKSNAASGCIKLKTSLGPVLLVYQSVNIMPHIFIKANPQQPLSPLTLDLTISTF